MMFNSRNDLSERPAKVFIPEYVPLDNKGEEAIVLGIGDALFPGREVEFTVLDTECDHPYTKNGIHVWPHKWFYSPWRSQPFIPSLSLKEMVGSAKSIFKHGLQYFPPWVERTPTPVRRCARAIRQIKTGTPVSGNNEFMEAMRRLCEMDYIAPGHDGGLHNEAECYVLNMLSDAGFPSGIFGSAMPLPIDNRHIHNLYHKTFSRARFIYTRNPKGADWAKQQFPDLNIELAPDPAFAMVPADQAVVDRIIAREGLGSFFETPVIMMTVVENNVTARLAFKEQMTAQGKEKAHTDLLGQLIGHLTKDLEANVLFLPHSIGPTKRLDDRIVARKIMERAQDRTGKVRLLENEYGARELKGLISRADMIIGERIHSLIGAVGVNTPFICLGSENDSRSTGIIGRMCDSEHLLYSLESPHITSLIAHVDRVWNSRELERKRLKKVTARLRKALRASSKTIRSRMGNGGIQKAWNEPMEQQRQAAMD